MTLAIRPETRRASLTSSALDCGRSAEPMKIEACARESMSPTMSKTKSTVPACVGPERTIRYEAAFCATRGDVGLAEPDRAGASLSGRVDLLRRVAPGRMRDTRAEEHDEEDGEEDEAHRQMVGTYGSYARFGRSQRSASSTSMRLRRA